MKMTVLRHEFLTSFPDRLEPGVLYVSIPYATAAHLCCCGCGTEVVTPLSPAGWKVTYDGESVSLHPSIGNWGLACKSHYWIQNDRVRWSRRFDANEIDAVRWRDAEDLSTHLSEMHTRPKAASHASVPGRARLLWHSLWRRLRG